MTTIVQGTNIELSPGIEEYVRDKLSPLEERHHGYVTGLAVRVGKESSLVKTVSAVWSLKGHVIRIRERGEDTYAIIDRLADASRVALEREKGRREYSARDGRIPSD